MNVRRLRIRDGPATSASDELTLYFAELGPPPDDPGRLLASSELERAARLRAPRIREQFLAARALLRGVLGRTLGLPPRDVPIEYESTGKPALAADANPHGWQFNLSHCEGMALVAVVRGRRVGVDLERVRPMANATALVERFFAPCERVEFAALGESEQLPAFFRAWTLKEAFLKALGVGVPSFERAAVTLRPGEPAAVVAYDGDETIGERWALGGWEAVPGFMAAVAVEAAGLRTLVVGE